MTETQHSIGEWGRETFGKKSPAFLFGRALEEMAELVEGFGYGYCGIVLRERAGVIMQQVPRDPAVPKRQLMDEAADVLIMLFQLSQELGYDLLKTVEAKMKVNRSRKWTIDETGSGHHES